MRKILLLYIIINTVLNAHFIVHDEEICLVDDLNNRNKVLIKFLFTSNKEFHVNITLKNLKGKVIERYESESQYEKNIAYTHKSREDVYICLMADTEVETEYSVNNGFTESDRFITKSSDIQEVNNIIRDEINVINNIIDRSESMLLKEDDINAENLSLNKAIIKICIIEIILVIFIVAVQYGLLSRYVNRNKFLN